MFICNRINVNTLCVNGYSYRRQTFKTDGQRLLDYAVKFARRQHRARFAVAELMFCDNYAHATYCLVYGMINSIHSMYVFMTVCVCCN